MKKLFACAALALGVFALSACGGVGSGNSASSSSSTTTSAGSGSSALGSILGATTNGETLGNVHFAINYLNNPVSYRLGESLIVIGAGNAAMDVCRTAIR